MKYVILIGLAVIVLIEYACMVVSKKADEEAEKMYQRRKGGKDNETD